MNTDSRNRETVTEPKGAGWKWIPDQGVYLWWDGERYTGRAEWDGAEWQVGPEPVPTLNEPPSRLRIALRIAIDFLAALFILFLLVPLFDDARTETDNEGAFVIAVAVAMFSILFGVFLVRGVDGLSVRRSAHRDSGRRKPPGVDPEPPAAPV